MRGLRGWGWGLEGGMIEGGGGGCCGWWVVVSGYSFPFRMVVLVVELLNP